MQNIGIAFSGARRDMRDSVTIVHADLAAHRNAHHTKLADRRELFERGFRGFAVMPGVGNDADKVAAFALRFGKIADVTKQAAQRRAQDVQNPQGPI
jgi:hypothetical protein